MPSALPKTFLILCLVQAMSSTHLTRPAPRQSVRIPGTDESASISGAGFERSWTDTGKRPPPTYLNLVFDHLASGHVMSTSNDGGQRTLLRSLLPSKLRRGTALYNCSSIEMGLEDLHSIQLLFTLRPEAIFSPAHLNLHLTAKQTQEHHTEHFLWTRTRQFYAVNLTRFIRGLKGPLGMLQLDMTFFNASQHEVPLDLLFDLDENGPFLLIHQSPLQIPNEETLQASSLQRRKRSVPEHSPASSRGRRSRSRQFHTAPDSTICRRAEWLVKPSDIGLDDIVAPPFLDLGFCTGKCPFPLLNEVFNFTLHSYFIDRHRILEGLATPEQLPGSSCVAVSYQPLMVMEGGAYGHIVAIHPNALVQSCGCRY